MNWYRFALVTGILLSLQTTLAGRIAVFGAVPILTIGLVAYVALWARPLEALLAAWIIGMGVDVLSVERLGVTAITHTVAALPVLGLRDYFFARSSATHFVMSLLAVVTQQVLAVLYASMVYPAAFSYTWALRGVVVSSVYSALLAVGIIGLLDRVGPSVVTRVARAGGAGRPVPG